MNWGYSSSGRIQLQGKHQNRNYFPVPRPEIRDVKDSSDLLSSKELHPQQGKDHDEQEQQEQQTDDGFHGVQQGHHQIPQGIPVPGLDQNSQGRKSVGKSLW